MKAKLIRWLLAESAYLEWRRRFIAHFEEELQPVWATVCAEGRLSDRVRFLRRANRERRQILKEKRKEFFDD